VQALFASNISASVTQCDTAAMQMVPTSFVVLLPAIVVPPSQGGNHVIGVRLAIQTSGHILPLSAMYTRAEVDPG